MSHTKELTANKLKVRIYATRTEMGKHAAKDVAERLRDLLAGQETVNMIFAAAPSQNEFLAALSAAKDIAWEKVNAFHMDEYIGWMKMRRSVSGSSSGSVFLIRFLSGKCFISTEALPIRRKNAAGIVHY